MGIVVATMLVGLASTPTPPPTSTSATTSTTTNLLNLLTQIGVWVGVAFGAFIFLFWISLIIWTFRDIRSRTQDIILQIGATLLVTVFFLGGLFIYWILRPRHTLAELYERQLEEESLLAEMTDRKTCAACHHRVEPDFQVCPSCGNRLKRPCPRCERLLEMKWNVCPYCAFSGAVDGQRPSTALRPPASVPMQRGPI